MSVNKVSYANQMLILSRPTVISVTTNCYLHLNEALTARQPGVTCMSIECSVSVTYSSKNQALFLNHVLFASQAGINCVSFNRLKEALFAPGVICVSVECYTISHSDVTCSSKKCYLHLDQALFCNHELFAPQPGFLSKCYVASQPAVICTSTRHCFFKHALFASQAGINYTSNQC